MAENLTEEIKELNDNARLLLSKYDGVFTKLNEEKALLLEQINDKGGESLDAIQLLLDGGNRGRLVNHYKQTLPLISHRTSCDAGLTDTGLFITLTPTNENSLFVIAMGANCHINLNTPNYGGEYILFRDDVELADVNTNNYKYSAVPLWHDVPVSLHFNDTPNTLEEITYKIKVNPQHQNGDGNTFYWSWDGYTRTPIYIDILEFNGGA